MTNKQKDQIFCCICRKAIPEDRLTRQSVTDSKECARKLREIRRRMHDLKKCRYCNTPSTPQERRLFKQWRATQPDAPKRGRRPKPRPDPNQAEITDMIHVN